MFSRILAAIPAPRAILAGALACTVLLALAPPAQARLAAAVQVEHERDYDDEILRAVRTEGDIWGGEQMTTPTPPPVFRNAPVAQEQPLTIVESTPWTRLWTRLATLLRHFGL